MCWPKTIPRSTKMGIKSSQKSKTNLQKLGKGNMIFNDFETRGLPKRVKMALKMTQEGFQDPKRRNKDLQ